MNFNGLDATDRGGIISVMLRIKAMMSLRVYYAVQLRKVLKYRFSKFGNVFLALVWAKF